MATESITVKCEAFSETINNTIKQYESFGWQLTNNQKIQECIDSGSSGMMVNGVYTPGTTPTYVTYN